ncbi:PH and SEC7 domain-containing protein [Salix suchowensis]|nr:PH and SEC7 domain-containing protein [Salix suchowensis]
MGLLDSPAMSPRETKIPKTTPRRPTQQPSTPTIIPPTPSPIAGPSSAKPLTGGSNGSSAQDLVNESGGDDSDSRQTNRRSLYRSPGTSSSPDLATLMRKAKAKDKALQGKSDKLKPAATFDRPSTATRSRSSTSSFKNPGEANTFGSRDNKGKSKALPTSPEWILTSPQTPIRAREESPTRIGSPDLSKPLPPIIGASPTEADPEDEDDDMDDKSMVFVEKSIRAPSPKPAPRPRRAPSPEPVTYDKSTDTSKTQVHNKRRSMSVSEFELKTAMAASSSVTPLPTPSRSTSKKEGPKQNWDDSLHGILDDFKDIRPPPQKAKTAPSSFALPTVKLSQSEVLQDEPPSPTTSPIIPPRTSSLYTGVRSATSGSGSPRVSARRTHSPLTSKTGTILGTAPQTPIRNKLRVQHRSTASSSEPSLIPISDDPRNFDRADLEKSVTLRRSSYFGTPSKESRNELGVNDLTLTRFASATVSPTRDDDSETLEARARDLANKCWAEDEEFLAKEKIAEWLGGRVVHAVTYSLLLLNTDLHVAELSTHMSRSQFVRNTLGTIQMQLQPPEQLSTSDLSYDDSGSSMRGSDADTIARTKRSDSITSWNSVSKEAAMAASPEHHSNGSTPSVQVALHSSQQRAPDVGSVYGRTWEADMENLLKVVPMYRNLLDFTDARSTHRICTTR